MAIGGISGGAADSELVEQLVTGPPTAPVSGVPASAGRPNARFARLVPNLVMTLAALFFLFPLYAQFRFAFQKVLVLQLGWDTLFKRWTITPLTDAFQADGFTTTLYLSIKLALCTVLLTMVLVLPTVLWVHLKVPRVRTLIEFLTVLPYVIPPIALVAGIRVIQPHARWFLNSDLSLVPFYTVLALPFTFRALDAGIRAVNIQTLVDASRSLGAGWGTTLLRALIPNLRTAIISSSFLTATVVLGEFTIASVLLKNTFPTFMATYYSSNGQGGMALAVLALVATTALLMILTFLTRRRGSAQIVSPF
jgi:putative spermidine/putrescine transport system permease protein